MDTLCLLRAGKLAGAKRLDLSCGLTEFPREIFALADSLEILNLTGNQLTSLPDDLARLRKLRILFCSSNDFTHLPAVLGECESLSMIGFKSNRIETIDERAFPRALRWLILTDNRIHLLPAAIGRCSKLQKLMLSGNELEELPQEMAACTNLELIRLAANKLHELPDWLFSLPRLSWLALAGNPFSVVPEEEPTLQGIDWAEIELREQLGEGASGVIHHAVHRSAERSVAVKLFKGAVTSDGLPLNEMAACLAAGSHPNLIEVLGCVTNHPENRMGLVMSLIDSEFGNLAGAPDFDSCTRDIYAPDARFDLGTLLRIASGIASAAQQLHARGIMHGDLYAHNVLWKSGGDCMLGDFGAASFVSLMNADAAGALQRIESRAFGCLLEELLERIVAEPSESKILHQLKALQARCCVPEVNSRPLFEEIIEDLRRISDTVPNPIP